LYALSQTSLEQMRGVQPLVCACACIAIRTSPIDFGIRAGGGLRTEADQAALYAQGRTAPGKIVTWTMNSKHRRQVDGFGHALDLIAFIDGKAVWTEEPYYAISKAMFDAAKLVGVELRWGGTFDTFDGPHFELAGRL
jgi:peptidoglycan LD-endopeptidase CwlK